MVISGKCFHILMIKTVVSTHEIAFFEYSKQSAKLYYVHTRKEIVTLIFLYGKENGVVVPHGWLKNEYAAKTWLGGLRKCHECLCSRKPEAITLTRSTSFNPENVKALF